jgi:hypothetical protein
MEQPAAFFRFTNRSARACTLDGYPGLQLLDASGRVINLTIGRGPSYQINDPGARVVTLTPDSSAYFGFGWSSVNQPNGNTVGCVMVTSAQATPPNATEQLSTTALLSPPVCSHAGGSVTAVALANAFDISSPD